VRLEPGNEDWTLSPPRIAAPLREFVARSFGAIEEVEILLLLRRSPRQWWRALQVAEALHLREEAARRCLETLSGRFLDVSVAAEVRFRYAPGNPEREARAAELAGAYENDRTELVSILMSSRAARDFARAFRLKIGDE
jgi:hypothetical protein